MKKRVIIFAACASCLAAGAAAAQEGTVTLPSSIERGPSLGGVGARISFLFLGDERISSGLEFGFASVSGSEKDMVHLGVSGSAVLEFEEPSRKMWHATFTARREWFNENTAGLYAGIGTGVYYLTERTEYWQADPINHARLDFRSVPGSSWQFGLNLGGGIQVQPIRHLGSLDLDARLHILPFAGSLGLQSVFTVSAGISIF
jgi:opacity protein-like surface antigen